MSFSRDMAQELGVLLRTDASHGFSLSCFGCPDASPDADTWQATSANASTVAIQDRTGHSAADCRDCCKVDHPIGSRTCDAKHDQSRAPASVLHNSNNGLSSPTYLRLHPSFHECARARDGKLARKQMDHEPSQRTPPKPAQRSSSTLTHTLQLQTDRGRFVTISERRTYLVSVLRGSQGLCRSADIRAPTCAWLAGRYSSDQSVNRLRGSHAQVLEQPHGVQFRCIRLRMSRFRGTPMGAS
jgi:hypothetical protein